MFNRSWVVVRLEGDLVEMVPHSWMRGNKLVMVPKVDSYSFQAMVEMSSPVNIHQFALRRCSVLFKEGTFHTFFVSNSSLVNSYIYVALEVRVFHCV